MVFHCSACLLQDFCNLLYAGLCGRVGHRLTIIHGCKDVMNDGLLSKSTPECNVESRVGLRSTFQGHCIVHAEYRETRENQAYVLVI